MSCELPPLAAELRRGKLTANELLTRYCRPVYAQPNSTRETARRIGRDRRTVRAMLGGATLDDED